MWTGTTRFPSLRDGSVPMPGSWRRIQRDWSMSSSRRTRRRRERARAKRVTPVRRLALPLRAALIVGGVIMIAGGVLLLARGNPDTDRRLGRLAGIVILLGCAAVLVGLIGRL